MQAQHESVHHEEPPAYLANSGLLSEPFADTPSGHFFYAGADGEQRLDLMHHLAPYSPLLVVIGEPGIGKTTLMYQFKARAKDNWRVMEVTARVDMDRDDFMGAMSDALGLPSQSQVDPSTQYLAVIAQLRALRQTAQIPILMIDDAQNLNASLLELLHKLCAENDDGHILSVILLGTSQLQTMWNRPALAPLAARVTHTFEMNPYTEEETARYIRHRLRAAGASDDGPFDSVTINKIHSASGGIPAKINDWAQQVLKDRSMGLDSRHAKNTSGEMTGQSRRRLVMLVGVIVVVLLIAGPLRSVLFKSSPLPPPQPQQSRTLSIPPPAEEDGAEERVIRTDGADASAPPPVTAGEETSSSVPGSVKTLPLPPLDTATVKEPVLAEPAPSSAPPVSEESKPSPSTASAPPPKAASATVKSVPPSPEKISKNKNIENIAGAADGADWLKAQAASNYTLQLMAVKDEETARQFIDAHHLQGKAAILPVDSHGQTLYAVLYGSYAQRGEAVRAANDLPAAWGTPKPWIRRFESIPGLPRP